MEILCSNKSISIKVLLLIAALFISPLLQAANPCVLHANESYANRKNSVNKSYLLITDKDDTRQKLEVFPVARSYNLLIKTENLEIIHCYILNDKGRKLHLPWQKLSKNKTIIDLFDLPKGNYRLHLETDKGSIEKKLMHRLS